MSDRGTVSIVANTYCLLKIPGLMFDRKYLVVNEKNLILATCCHKNYYYKQMKPIVKLCLTQEDMPRDTIHFGRALVCGSCVKNVAAQPFVKDICYLGQPK